MKSYQDDFALFEDAAVQVGRLKTVKFDYYVNHDGNQHWFETLGAALDYCNLNELEIDYLG